MCTILNGMKRFFNTHCSHTPYSKNLLSVDKVARRILCYIRCFLNTLYIYGNAVRRTMYAYNVRVLLPVRAASYECCYSSAQQTAGLLRLPYK